MTRQREIMVNAAELDGLLHATLVTFKDREAIKEAAGKEPPSLTFLVSTIKAMRRVVSDQFPKRPKTKKKYQMLLESVGNPDFGQYAPVSEPAWVAGDTLKDMRKEAAGYQAKWELGGGNWTNQEVLEGDKVVAHFAYNLRCFEGKFDAKNWASAKEIVFGEGA